MLIIVPRLVLVFPPDWLRGWYEIFRPIKNTGKWPHGRKNANDRGTHGFNFVPDWLRSLREILRPITGRSEANQSNTGFLFTLTWKFVHKLYLDVNFCDSIFLRTGAMMVQLLFYRLKIQSMRHETELDVGLGKWALNLFMSYWSFCVVLWSVCVCVCERGRRGGEGREGYNKIIWFYHWPP